MMVDVEEGRKRLCWEEDTFSGGLAKNEDIFVCPTLRLFFFDSPFSSSPLLLFFVDDDAGPSDEEISAAPGKFCELPGESNGDNPSGCSGWEDEASTIDDCANGSLGTVSCKLLDEVEGAGLSLDALAVKKFESSCCLNSSQNLADMRGGFRFASSNFIASWSVMVLPESSCISS